MATSPVGSSAQVTPTAKRSPRPPPGSSDGAPPRSVGGSPRGAPSQIAGMDCQDLMECDTLFWFAAAKRGLEPIDFQVKTPKDFAERGQPPDVGARKWSQWNATRNRHLIQVLTERQNLERQQAFQQQVEALKSQKAAQPPKPAGRSPHPPPAEGRPQPPSTLPVDSSATAIRNRLTFADAQTEMVAKRKQDRQRQEEAEQAKLKQIYDNINARNMEQVRADRQRENHRLKQQRDREERIRQEEERMCKREEDLKAEQESRMEYLELKKHHVDKIMVERQRQLTDISQQLYERDLAKQMHSELVREEQQNLLNEKWDQKLAYVEKQNWMHRERKQFQLHVMDEIRTQRQARAEAVKKKKQEQEAIRREWLEHKDREQVDVHEKARQQRREEVLKGVKSKKMKEEARLKATRERAAQIEEERTTFLANRLWANDIQAQGQMSKHNQDIQARRERLQEEQQKKREQAARVQKGLEFQQNLKQNQINEKYLKTLLNEQQRASVMNEQTKKRQQASIQLVTMPKRVGLPRTPRKRPPTQQKEGEEGTEGGVEGATDGDAGADAEVTA